MNYHIVRGIIEVKSGVHIGRERENLDIGGIENSVARIKKVVKGRTYEEPFIPGSSLKGKMRALIEMNLDLKNKINKHEPYMGLPTRIDHKRAKGYKDSIFIRLFGSNEDVWHYGPARLIFRDAALTDEFSKLCVEGKLETEIKTETAVLRDVGKSYNIRPIERVPAGIKFDMELVLRCFNGEDTENIEKYKNMIKLGLSLLRIDYIGAGGSRGSGKIEFVDLKFDGEEFSLYSEKELSELTLKDFELEEAMA